MPYPTAHPAAVLPLLRRLGPWGVPSALVIGSVVPDFWYFVPGLHRADSHSLAGLAWFCLPVGLAAYAAFHLLLKAPLVALAPPAIGARLARHCNASLPQAPWRAVVASLLVGAVTHLAWDALTHSGADGSVLVERLLQHGSTVLGTAIVVLWCVRALRRMPPVPGARVSLPPAQRAAILLALGAAAFVSAAWALGAAWPEADTYAALRAAARAAGVSGAGGLGLALLAYGALWKLRKNSGRRR